MIPLQTRGPASAASTGLRVARPDEGLLRAIASGDLSALGELYDRHARDVWRAVERTLGSAVDVDDVVHAVFLKLPQIASGYDGRENARPWLVGIGVRIALRHRRSAGRFVKMLVSFAQTSDVHRQSLTHGNPERLACHRSELRRFEAALGKLSAKKRAVFMLVELNGLSTDEVARALEIPQATVRTRLHHARRELHEALEAEGSDR